MTRHGIQVQRFVRALRDGIRNLTRFGVSGQGKNALEELRFELNLNRLVGGRQARDIFSVLKGVHLSLGFKGTAED